MPGGVERRRIRKKLENGEGRHALAAATLADQSEGFACVDIEAHAVDCAHEAILGVEVCSQVANAQKLSVAFIHLVIT